MFVCMFLIVFCFLLFVFVSVFCGGFGVMSRSVVDERESYRRDQWYRFDGTTFVEVEPSGERKLPVTEEALEAVKRVRQAAQSVIGLRPELSLCASAMLLAAAELPDIADRVKALGRRVYGA